MLSPREEIGLNDFQNSERMSDKLGPPPSCPAPSRAEETRGAKKRGEGNRRTVDERIWEESGVGGGGGGEEANITCDSTNRSVSTA